MPFEKGSGRSSQTKTDVRHDAERQRDEGRQKGVLAVTGLDMESWPGPSQEPLEAKPRNAFSPEPQNAGSPNTPLLQPGRPVLTSDLQKGRCSASAWSPQSLAGCEGGRGGLLGPLARLQFQLNTHLAWTRETALHMCPCLEPSLTVSF